MFDFLSRAFGGMNPNASVYFDPSIGKVIGIPGGEPPRPTPKPDVPYGGPDMPPMARGTPSAPPAQMPQMREPMNPPPAPQNPGGVGWSDMPHMARTGNPLLDFINAKYRTGGTF